MKPTAGMAMVAGNTGSLPRCIFSSISIAPRRLIDRSGLMKLLGYAYRFFSNFIFLAIVYFSLNFMDTYQQRAIVAALVLAFAAMRAISALRSFYFFQKIERLELETRRIAGQLTGAPAESNVRKLLINEVGDLRRAGEMMSYIDLLFLSLIVLLCVAKIVTE